MASRAKVKNLPRPSDNAGSIQLNLVDGTRQPIAASVEVLIRIVDGNQTQRYWDYKKGSSIKFANLPVFDNFGDAYTVLVTSKGFQDAGFSPVRVKLDGTAVADLMLLAKKSQFWFASWQQIEDAFPRVASFLMLSSTEAEARTRFESLRQSKQAALASLLNLITAMGTINLPTQTPLEYFREILWDDSMQQDRFFAYADRRLVDQV